VVAHCCSPGAPACDRKSAGYCAKYDAKTNSQSSGFIVGMAETTH